MFKTECAAAPIEFATVRRLTELFQTSITATAIRLVERGEFPALLVCTDRFGARVWFVRGPDVPDSVWPLDGPEAPPDHTTLSRRGQHLDLRLRGVPRRAGLHLIIDSTGLSIAGAGEWATAKHGGRGTRGWKNLPVGVDHTGVIVAHALTDATGDDATTGVELIEAVNDDIASVTADTDIEHIVARSEAHDSGLCAADAASQRRFASDLLNLTLASPAVNRTHKNDKDAAEWLPDLNQCWFADRVVAVRRKFGLTIDPREAAALDRVLVGCRSTAMLVVPRPAASTQRPTPPPALSPPVSEALARWDDNGNGRDYLRGSAPAWDRPCAPRAPRLSLHARRRQRRHRV